MERMKYFRFWCQKVLPLVYDDSLSYYEILCKVVKYINDLIKSDAEIIENVNQLRADLDVVQEWIDNFDTAFIQQIVDEYIRKSIKNVYFGLTYDGYFAAYLPESWDGVEFGTIQNGDLYGHLTITY